MNEHILLLEDDTMIASGLVYALENEGYEVVYCKSIKEATQAMSQLSFQLALLDMQLPDGSGKDLADILLERQTPIIFLTVVDDENQIVEAFEKGVKDYVTKPFRIRELLARVKRSIHDGSSDASKMMHLGRLKIDTQSAKVYKESEIIELTALEYKLLLIFSNNPSRILTRGQILESIWDEGGAYVEDNTLTVYIKRLREKCGDAIRIETVRGMGYRVDQ